MTDLPELPERHRSPSKFDGFSLRYRVAHALKINQDDLIPLFEKRYLAGESAVEISEWLLRETGLTYSPRSIQRHLRKRGIMRPLKEAFRNAIRRGRVIWQLEADAERRAQARHQVSRKLRQEIFTRDGFRCVLCGNDPAHGALLQLDHIVARVHGGADDPQNLRTLCIDCNIGKQAINNEYDIQGTMRSGAGEHG